MTQNTAPPVGRPAPHSFLAFCMRSFLSYRTWPVQAVFRVVPAGQGEPSGHLSVISPGRGRLGPCYPLAQRQKAVGHSWEPLWGPPWPGGGGGGAASSGAWGPGAPSLLSPSALSEAPRSALSGLTERTIVCARVLGEGQGQRAPVQAHSWTPLEAPHWEEGHWCFGSWVPAAQPQSRLRGTT